MPIPKKYRADFHSNGTYHVYNRTNNKERLFIDDADYKAFRSKRKKFLLPVLKIRVWNLLPNHFHLVVRIKRKSEIKKFLNKRKPENLTSTEIKFLEDKISVHELVIHYFTRFFQSYSQSFNYRHKRNGNLFYKSFKRVVIAGRKELMDITLYVHANTKKHGWKECFTRHRWSSWQEILARAGTRNEPDSLIRLFGGKERFIALHQEHANKYERPGT